ncbi:AAWKG family protein [Streptomyces sp. NPDC056707]|uniref:AAWKG family protein n=1 Tax=Streptomyces sp. NPDC056707 TaxID=3345919 RepID=UPI0036BD73EC
MPDDDWGRTVRLLTGYPMPDRASLFEDTKHKSTGSGDGTEIPLMTVNIYSFGNIAPTENPDVSAIRDHDWVLAAYSDYDKMNLYKISIDFAWDRNSASVIPGTSADQYVFGSAVALGALSDAPYSTLGVSHGGLSVDGAGAVVLKSLADAAGAFDRTALFFQKHEAILKQWGDSFGSDGSSWKGSAAGAFLDMVVTLRKNYANYYSQFTPSGFSSGQMSLHSVYGKSFSSTLQGTALVDGASAIHQSAWELWQGWHRWAADRRSNVLNHLTDILQDVTQWAMANNLGKALQVKGGTYHYTYGSSTGKIISGPGYWQDHPVYGDLSKPAAWAAVAKEAIRRWNGFVDETLAPVARAQASEVNNALIDASRVVEQPVTTLNTSTTGSQTQGPDTKMPDIKMPDIKMPDMPDTSGAGSGGPDVKGVDLPDLGGSQSTGSGLGTQGSGGPDVKGVDLPDLGGSQSTGSGPGTQGVGVPDLGGVPDSGSAFSTQGVGVPDLGGVPVVAPVGLPGFSSAGPAGGMPGRGVSVTQPDGTVVTTYPDGTVMTLDPDGSETVTSPDGTVSVTGPDGLTTVTSPDGSITTFNPDGSVVTTHPDGFTTVVGSDGETTVYGPDGAATPIDLPDFGNSVSSNPVLDSGSQSVVGGGGYELSTGGQQSAPSYEEAGYDLSTDFPSYGVGADPEFAVGGGLGGAFDAKGPAGMPMAPLGGLGGMGAMQAMGADRMREAMGGDFGTQGSPRGSSAAVPASSQSAAPPMMPPMNGAGGQNTESKDRERANWVSEDEDVWGTEDSGAPAAIGREEQAVNVQYSNFRTGERT